MSLSLLLRRRTRFTPVSVAGKFVNYDASLLSGSDASAISSITDSFGLQVPLAQGTGANQPILKLGVVNGKNCARFDGSNDFMITGAFGSPPAQPITLILVVRETVVSGTQRIIDNTTGGRLLFGSAGASYQFFAGSLLTGGTPDASVVNIFSLKFAGASSRVRKNGAQIFAGDAGANGFGSLSLGADNTGANCAPMDFCQLLAYTSLSDANELLLEAYLRSYWGPP